MVARKTFLNVFYNVILELVLYGCVWRWFGTSAAVPGPLPGYPRRAAFLALCLALVLPDHAGRCGFHGFHVAVYS